MYEYLYFSYIILIFFRGLVEIMKKQATKITRRKKSKGVLNYDRGNVFISAWNFVREKVV